MKFERTVFNIDIYGDSFTVKKMSARELDGHQQILKELDDKNEDATDATYNMLNEQGVPREVAENMEIEHLTELIGSILGTLAKK